MRFAEFDLRSLKLFRILLGCILVRFALMELTHLSSLYGPEGILPADAVCRLLGHGVPVLSIYCWNSSLFFQASLFFVQAVLGVLLACGWRVRVTTILSAYLFYAFRTRLDFFINGGDNSLLWLGFAAIFLPLDGVRSRVSQSDGRARTPGTIYFTLQIVVLYVFAGLNKYGVTWRNGEAVHNALLNVYQSSKVSEEVATWIHACHFATYVVPMIEIGGPLLLLMPRLSDRGRCLLIASFIAFHLVLDVLLNVDPLGWIGCAVWLSFLPSAFWERVGFARPLAREVSSRSRFGNTLAFGGGALAVILGTISLPWDFLASSGLKSFDETLAHVGVVQHWIFFAPDVDLISNWVEVSGADEDGRPVGLDWVRKEIYDAGSESASLERFKRTIRDRRWQKLYLEFQIQNRARIYHKTFGAYVCATFKSQKIRTIIVRENGATSPKNLFFYDCASRHLSWPPT